jgi:hypothetical protein
MSGLSIRTVSNAMVELGAWGYLLKDRQSVEEAGGRRLTVYTFGSVDHETIRRSVTAFMPRVATEPHRPKSPGQVSVPRPRGYVTQ